MIDSSYFKKGELFIPNNKDISAQPVGSPTVQSEIDSFIDKYERELLLNAFGVTLYNELQIALAKLPFVADLTPPSLATAEQKWIDLVNGKDYTINGKTYIWDGLKGYNKDSLIAKFIYCNYLRNDELTYTTVGVVKNTSKNAENWSATPKFIKVWNEFLRQYQSSKNANPVIIQNAFGEIGLDYYGNKDAKVSLYQYLNDANELDPTSFPDFEFKFYESYNSFGI